MTHRHLAGARILAQGLVPPSVSEPSTSAAVSSSGTEERTASSTSTAAYPTPAQVAHGFAAHQGQDLSGVVSSLALRSGGDAAAVLTAFDRGEIVRGYPMRGTVFATSAATLPWLTQLCAGAPVRAAIKRRSSLGLTDEHVGRAGEILEELAVPASTPGVGRGVTRAELFAAWEAAGVPTRGGCGYHLLVHHISTGTACYGPWRDGDTAVVHAPTWLPSGSDLEGTFHGDEHAALAELALRYFTSHGPASVRDLAWWSKLPMGRITAALAEASDRLESGWADAQGRLHADPAKAVASRGETLYWRPGLAEEYAAREKETMRELLLPGFDELVLGYQDRLYLMDDERHARLVPGNNGVFKRTAVRRGEVVGIWSRAGTGSRRRFVLDPVTPISPTQTSRFETLFARFPYPSD
ncbi:winged helix DNA-binding domain-containing protein [Brachybacterium timonense]|uniref:winged helix DNA-binding domain-containing protein n=1 Tax=Brachybacterium timonense TaxID=2050896 RepID=UPI000D0B3B41|nr:winged helix DNA-binding domain-containing protein [Brachybacterium timonense]